MASIDSGWNEYRGWSARSRDLQNVLARWNWMSLASTSAAVLLGALATVIQKDSEVGRKVVLGAAAIAALAPVIGREMLASASEAKWIRARAIAEAVKSECFRVIAALPPYDGADATDKFIAWRTDLTADAAKEGVTVLTSPAPAAGDPRRPAPGMDAAWYITNRLIEQRDWYCAAQLKNERFARWLRGLNICASVLTAAFAAIAVGVDWAAAWIGAFGTIAAAITALGALQRRNYLAATYGANALALDRVKEWYDGGGHDLKQLVDRTESLLNAEHASWAAHVSTPDSTKAAAGGGAADDGAGGTPDTPTNP